MAKSEKIIQPINASMDDIAKAVVSPKTEKEDSSEDDKIINRCKKKNKRNIDNKFIQWYIYNM